MFECGAEGGERGVLEQDDTEEAGPTLRRISIIFALRYSLRARGSCGWRAVRHRLRLIALWLSHVHPAYSDRRGWRAAFILPLLSLQSLTTAFAAICRIAQDAPGATKRTAWRTARAANSQLARHSRRVLCNRPTPLPCLSRERAEGLGNLFAMVSVPWQRADAAGTSSERGCG